MTAVVRVPTLVHCEVCAAQPGPEADAATCDVCTWTASGPWSVAAASHHHAESQHAWTLTRRREGGRWEAPKVETITTARWHELTERAHDAACEAHAELSGRDDADRWVECGVHTRVVWFAATRLLLEDVGITIDVEA